MVVSEEHKAVMRDDVGVIGVAIERHLTADSFFSRGDGYLFTFFIDDKLACVTTHKAAGPEHKRDYLAFEALFAQALTKVVGQPANGGAGFVGVSGVLEAHAGILAQWRGIRGHETHLLAPKQLGKPATQHSKAGLLSLLSPGFKLCQGGTAKNPSVDY